MPFQPGVSGNPGGKPKAAISLTDIPQDRVAKADNLRSGAYIIAKELELRIIDGLRRAGKKELPKGLRDAVWCHGVEADKVLQGAQDAPTTINQVNLLFGSIAPAMQRTLLGKAFDVLPAQLVDNLQSGDETPQDVVEASIIDSINPDIKP